MRHVSEWPNPVREIEHTTISMSDGTRLAARIWMPESAEQQPVPALLEYIPYRKREWTATRDAVTHPYLAGHGYACVRVDLRGSGESEGVLRDEYLEQELQDGEEVIRWIARQRWCDGQVAMIGISWGGFNGLQIAARQPPELKTVITLCSTDNRYTEDVHYMGGCLLGDNLSWASTMFAYNTAPPDPELVGENWREMWMDRLEGSGVWLAEWLSHQRRDEYWKHGSVCEDYSRIRVPVLATSGWADSYTNAVFRLLENLHVPRKGIVGPWSHKYPHLGIPGPAIGFLQECLRWLDYWMKNRETGIMDEPMLRAWIQDSMPPSTEYHERSGHWVGEPEWPSPHIEERLFRLAPDWLLPIEEKPAYEHELTLQSPLSVGLFSGKWCSETAPPDLPDDQREEDGGALVFESAPLTEEMQLLGAPVVELALSADRPVAMVAVRLSEVLPTGPATRLTYGLMNLNHRDGHEHPEPLQPGERYRIRIQLNDIGEKIPAGHRLRLSVSTTYWPHAWTPPELVQLKLDPAGSRLTLPVRRPRPEDRDLSRFPEPEGAPPLPVETVEPPEHYWRVIRYLGSNRSVLEVLRDRGVLRFPGNWEAWSRAVERYSADHSVWNSVRGETKWTHGFRRGEHWEVYTVTRTVLTSDTESFHIDADLDAYENGRRVYCRTWEYTIPREHL